MYSYRSLLKEENKILRCILINHLWLFIFISIINILLYRKMFFLYKVYAAFYLICTIIIILFIFVPIYPLILIFKKKLYTNNILLLKKISFFFIVIALFCGILINLMIFLNIYSLFTFFRECPYNYSYNDIQNLYNIDPNTNISVQNTNNKCSNKICLLIGTINNGTELYSYLCNFDSSYDFDSFIDQLARKIFSVSNKENNDKIKCRIFDNDNENEEILAQNEPINKQIIKSYYDICSVGNIFYRCNRKEKPKNYKVKTDSYDFSCPIIYDNIVVILLGFISIIFNLIGSLIIFLYEFLIFRKILILYHNIYNFEQGIKISLSGTTKNSSQLKPNSNNNIVEVNSNSNNSNINSRYLIIDSNAPRNQRNNINENDINSNNEFNSEDIISIRKKKNSHSQELPEDAINERNKIKFDHINIKESKNELIDDKSNNSNNTVEFRPINLKGIDDEKQGKYLTESNNVINNFNSKLNK